MESPSILVDTSVLIDYFRKKNKENSLLYKISLKHSLAVSTITEFEFFVGLSEKHLEFTSRLTIWRVLRYHGAPHVSEELFLFLIVFFL